MRREEHLDPDDLNRPDWNSLKANYSKHDVGEAYFIGRANQMGLEAEHWGIDMRNESEDLIFDDKMDLRLWEPLDGQERQPDPPNGYHGNVYKQRTLDGDPMAYAYAEERDDVDLGSVSNERLGLEGWKLRGVVDVKTKANPDWLGVLNIRHLAHYAEHSTRYDVPVFIYFTMVDMDTETVGKENILVPVTTDWDYETVIEHFDHDADLSLRWNSLKQHVNECDIVDRAFRAPDGNPVVHTDETHYNDFDWFTAQL